MNFRHDIVIVGAGLAGLRAAVECVKNTDVAIVSKVLPTRSHSCAAQGGITASIGNDEEDHWEWHMFDTVKGSDYLADQDAVEIMVRDAPRVIYELEHMGVPFSRNADGKISQRNFGGHTRDYGKKPVKRACYASDRTGRVVLDTLYDQCLRYQVKFYPEHYVLSLVIDEGKCTGIVTYDLSSGELNYIQAKAILLATGGCGRIFKTTSNGFASTGDGLNLAHRAGIPLMDMEFVQFHPTGLYPLGILVSEAARGEGGILKNRLGERFMERYAPTVKDLAARDVVSRSILTEIYEGRGFEGGYVHLDLTHLGKEKILERLWEITSFVRIYLGIDPVHEPVPVYPTCHYLMGGIPTDTDGRVMYKESGTITKGLYAAGECACVSVHGANRLGCNSLLDTLVFGRRCGSVMKEDISEIEHQPVYQSDPLKKTKEKIANLLDHKGGEKIDDIRRNMQSVMMDYCSVFRNEKGLNKGLLDIKSLKTRFADIEIVNKGEKFNYELMEVIELGHQLDLAEVILLSAFYRKESRGAHFREDYPKRDDKNYLKHTLVSSTGEVKYKPVTITQFQPEARVY